MKFRYDSYCGLYCGACSILIANESGMLEEKAAEWEMTKEDASCFGCRSDHNAVFCSGCVIKNCAKEKEVDYCFNCDEYPCEAVEDFQKDSAPHHSVITVNSESMKKTGIEQWLETQKKRWSCSKCGTRFSWYDEECGKCGAKLYSSVDEDRDLSSP